MSRRYWTHRAYLEQCPLIAEAYRVVQRALKSGALKPAKDHACVDCGKPAKCWDHRDYREPLAVEPVCLSCNRRRVPALPYLDAPQLSAHAKRSFRGQHEMRRFAAPAPKQARTA